MSENKVNKYYADIGGHVTVRLMLPELWHHISRSYQIKRVVFTLRSSLKPKAITTKLPSSKQPNVSSDRQHTHSIKEPVLKLESKPLVGSEIVQPLTMVSNKTKQKKRVVKHEETTKVTPVKRNSGHHYFGMRGRYTILMFYIQAGIEINTLFPKVQNLKRIMSESFLLPPLHIRSLKDIEHNIHTMTFEEQLGSLDYYRRFNNLQYGDVTKPDIHYLLSPNELIDADMIQYIKTNAARLTQYVKSKQDVILNINVGINNKSEVIHFVDSDSVYLISNIERIDGSNVKQLINTLIYKYMLLELQFDVAIQQLVILIPDKNIEYVLKINELSQDLLSNLEQLALNKIRFTESE